MSGHPGTELTPQLILMILYSCTVHSCLCLCLSRKQESVSQLLHIFNLAFLNVLSFPVNNKKTKEDTAEGFDSTDDYAM